MNISLTKISYWTNDEKKAYLEYSRASLVAKRLGYPRHAKLFKEMAADEKKHERYLKVILRG